MGLAGSGLSKNGGRLAPKMVGWFMLICAQIQTHKLECIFVMVCMSLPHGVINCFDRGEWGGGWRDAPIHQHGYRMCQVTGVDYTWWCN